MILRDAYGNIIDFVIYNDVLPWPEDADGEGAFLKLISLDLDNALASSWVAQNDTPENLSSPQFQSESFISVYPNPVSDVLVIDGINELYDVEIFDIHGKKIMSAYKANTLKLNSLNTGIYLLKVFDDSSTHNFKIVKD